MIRSFITLFLVSTFSFSLKAQYDIPKKPSTQKAVYQYTSLISKSQEQKLNEKLIKYVTDRPGHDKRYAINPSKIQQELDWKPQISFE